jgi:catechol 2,3-dioxygenase-like lactoylglutathione lyase family enzyme
MGVQAIHHHKIFVSDMDRSIVFYRDLLGFELMQDVVRENLPAYDQIMGYDDIKIRVVMMNVPGKPDNLIALLQFLNPPITSREQAISYVGTQALAVVVDNIDEEYNKLTEAGVRFQGPPVDIVRDGKLVAKANYLYDPDDMAIELYEMA